MRQVGSGYMNAAYPASMQRLDHHLTSVFRLCVGQTNKGLGSLSFGKGYVQPLLLIMTDRI